MGGGGDGPAGLEEALAAEAHVVLRALHVVREVAEGDLRLDHPELCQVAGGVGVLGAEGGAEGVDVGQRARVVLPLHLAGDREVRLLAEEVLRVVDAPVF